MIFSSRKIWVFLFCVSLLLNVGLYYQWSHEAFHQQEVETKSQNFTLLYPPLSELSHEEFIAIKQNYATNFRDLKEAINSSVKLSPGQTYAFYFQSLNTGAWTGIHEKETFYSGSLRKIPLLVAALKQVEEGTLDFNTPITILPEDINPYSGPLASRGAGYTVTLFELMNYTTFYSDNTAANALLRTVGKLEVIDVMFNTGLSFNTFLNNNNKKGIDTYPFSTKEFSNSFRSLYYSSVLKRKDSQLLLSLLAHTSFRSGLPAGVPENIVVSHKVSSFFETSQHHDCGIIYYPQQPYILCVMTEGMSESEADQLISSISKQAYEYVDALNSDNN